MATGREVAHLKQEVWSFTAVKLTTLKLSGLKQLSLFLPLWAQFCGLIGLCWECFCFHHLGFLLGLQVCWQLTGMLGGLGLGLSPSPCSLRACP